MTSPGRDGTVAGLLSAVKPTFMLPAVGLSVAGTLSTPIVSVRIAAVHAFTVGVALYVAHVVDEYVDGHVRGEEDPLLSAVDCRDATVVASVTFFAALAALWELGALAAAVATLPLWVLAVLHSPVLDSRPVIGTLDYPVGVSLAFIAGALAQTDDVTVSAFAIAITFTATLAGLNVAIDRLDRSFDATIDKHTLPVLLGDRTSAGVAGALHALAGALVAGFVATGVLPAVALAATAAALASVMVAVLLPARRAVHVQMALAYPFIGLLLLAHCTVTACAVDGLLGVFGLV